MKIYTFLIVLSMAFTGLVAQTTHEVMQSGFSFDPATITIPAGDSVRFVGTSSHPILQVSQATWNANGTEPLAGGFSFPSGSGIAGFPQAGTYYYVCTVHVASHNMKGKIIVTAATALDPAAKSDQALVYPVPLAGDELSIQLNETGYVPVVVEVFDTDGKPLLIYRGACNNGLVNMNCSQLGKGVYLLRAKTAKSSWVTRMVRL